MMDESGSARGETGPDCLKLATLFERVSTRQALYWRKPASQPHNRQSHPLNRCLRAREETHNEDSCEKRRVR